MDKLLTYNSIEADKKSLYLIRNGGSLIKQADANEWLPEIKEFVNELTPKENHIYTLCNALGAGEFWSSNVNGDYFPERALQKYHDTFVDYGMPYMMHINKDPEKSYGNVLCSAYNPKMHRVELVVAYDKARLPSKYIKKIESDENVNLSMGCRVPYDVCSICGNVAPTPEQYCNCIKEHGLNHMYDDGKKLYVINTEPQFFDISIVIVPADKTARILERLNLQDRPPREVIKLTKSAAKTTGAVKTAGVQKSPYSLGDLVDLLPDLSYTALVKVAKATKTSECFISSLSQSKKYLKPHEVQTVLLLQQGNEKIAKAIYTSKTYFQGEPGAADVGKLLSTAPVPLEDIPNRLSNIKQAMISEVVQGQVSPSTSYGLETLSGNHGLLSQLTAIANLTAIAGMVLNQNINSWIPLLLTGANVTNVILNKANTAAAPILPQRDLMLAPLIYAKEASALSLKELYSLPVISAIKSTSKIQSWEKTATDILTEGVLRLKAKKIIKDPSCA